MTYIKGSLLAVFICLTSCATMDRLTLANYSMKHNAGDEGSPPHDFFAPPRLSDGLALNYANHVEIVMRCNSTNSRISREVSATAQIALAAFAGAGAAFSYSDKTIAILGLGSAAIPDLQGIFNAKGRAEVYNQAADMIQTATLDYYSFNGNPSSVDFTPNGLTVVKRVSAAISLVSASLNNQLPTRKQMMEATEPMTKTGTVPQTAGEEPANTVIPASEAPVITEEVVKQVPVPITTEEVKKRLEEARTQGKKDALQLRAKTAFVDWKEGKSDADAAAILNDLDAPGKHPRTIGGLDEFIEASEDINTLNTIESKLKQ